jgi:hypothetical protein
MALFARSNRVVEGIVPPNRQFLAPVARLLDFVAETGSEAISGRNAQQRPRFPACRPVFEYTRGIWHSAVAIGADNEVLIGLVERSGEISFFHSFPSSKRQQVSPHNPLPPFPRCREKRYIESTTRAKILLVALGALPLAFTSRVLASDI